MPRTVWVIASLLALGACTDSSNSTAASPSAEGPDTTDSGPSKPSGSHGGDPLAQDSSAGSGLGSTGPAPTITSIPCHVDEAMVPAKAEPTKPGGKPAPA